ncbi:MAG: hypothetical protein HND48_11115 [Chloroflexi bacterium]|nr:hypothetical protein [Chloroflexota bacterium]
MTRYGHGSVCWPVSGLLIDLDEDLEQNGDSRGDQLADKLLKRLQIIAVVEDAGDHEHNRAAEESGQPQGLTRIEARNWEKLCDQHSREKRPEDRDDTQLRDGFAVFSATARHRHKAPAFAKPDRQRREQQRAG